MLYVVLCDLQHWHPVVDGCWIYTVLWYIYFTVFASTTYDTVASSICGIIGLGSMLGSWRYSIVILGAMMLILFLWGKLFLQKQCDVSGD